MTPFSLLRAICEKVGTSAFERQLGAVQHTQASDKIIVLNNFKSGYKAFLFLFFLGDVNSLPFLGKNIFISYFLA